jgi:hypothetical protein
LRTRLTAGVLMSRDLLCIAEPSSQVSPRLSTVRIPGQAFARSAQIAPRRSPVPTRLAPSRKALRIGSALASIAPYDQAQSLIRQSAFGINERCSDGTLHRQTAPLGPRHICRGRGEHQRRRGDRGTLDQRLDRALSTGAPPAECRLRKAEGRGFDPRRPLSRPRRGSHKLAADRYFWRCGAPAKKNGRPE